MRLYDCVNNVLKRLDDYPSVGGESIWTRAEVELYVKDGYDAFCRQTQSILDYFYPENVPLAGNYVGRWERNYFDPGMVAIGIINYSGGYWERDYAEASAIGPANSTQPWESEYLSTVFAVSMHPVPEDNVRVDRAVHEYAELEGEYTRWLEENDRAYQTTMGEPTRFSMDRDGMSRLRIVPAGDGGATVPEVTGTFGLLRQKTYLGAVSYWPLNETSGTRYDDIGTNHLTDVNTVGYATGVYGNGASLTAASFEAFSLANNGSLLMDTTLTFSFWFKMGTCPYSDINIISKEGGGTGDYTLHISNVTKVMRFGVYYSGGSATYATNPTVVTPGVWTHIVCGWDAVMGKAFIAQDGGSLTYSATVAPLKTTNDLYFGRYGGGAGTADYQGELDEIAMFRGRMLTAAERLALYDAAGTETFIESQFEDTVVGSWGALRYCGGDFPMGAPYGISRRWYSDENNTRVEYFRLGKTLDGNQVELPNRFAKYVEFYAQAKALERDGAGQDLKLAQHFASRFDEGVRRMVLRLSENKRSRLSAIGSAGKVSRTPALARLPYRYGRQIRRGY